MTPTTNRLPGEEERPTAADAPRDLSVARLRASASPSRRGSDEPRWAAPHPGRRSELEEPCVCRGPDIVALTPLPTDVVYAVQRHQVEPAHIAYDEAHGIPLSEAQLRARAVDGDPYRSTFGGF